MNWAPYQGAQTCTGTPATGSRELQAWIDENYEGQSYGIYNCRSVRGGSTTSLHGEGRALDWGLRMIGGRANPIGHTILRRIAAHGARLGIQCVIWDRRIYSGASPNGRYYGGVSPHYDHLHIELSWDGARNLTVATLRAVLSGGAGPAPTPTPTRNVSLEDDMIMFWHQGGLFLLSGGRRSPGGLPGSVADQLTAAGVKRVGKPADDSPLFHWLPPFK